MTLRGQIAVYRHLMFSWCRYTVKVAASISCNVIICMNLLCMSFIDTVIELQHQCTFAYNRHRFRSGGREWLGTDKILSKALQLLQIPVDMKMQAWICNAKWKRCISSPHIQTATPHIPLYTISMLLVLVVYRYYFGIIVIFLKIHINHAF